jgi:hypothetical protein
MNRRLRVQFDLTFPPEALRFCLAAALIAATAVEVASESVTLTTYYPAPSGIYAKLITTGNTYLARDSGNVGIGTASPAQKLEVNGSVKVDGPGIYNNFGSQLIQTNASDWTRWNQGSGSVWGNEMYQSLALPTGGLAVGTLSSQAPGNIYATGTLEIDGAGSSYVQGSLGVGTASPSGTMDVNGTISARGCSNVGQTGYSGGTTSYCAGGTYATWIWGYLSYYQTGTTPSAADPSVGGGVMYCCPCPAGGCPL